MGNQFCSHPEYVNLWFSCCLYAKLLACRLHIVQLFTTAPGLTFLSTDRQCIVRGRTDSLRQLTTIRVSNIRRYNGLQSLKRGSDTSTATTIMSACVWLWHRVVCWCEIHRETLTGETVHAIVFVWNCHIRFLHPERSWPCCQHATHQHVCSVAVATAGCFLQKVCISGLERGMLFGSISASVADVELRHVLTEITAGAGWTWSVHYQHSVANVTMSTSVLLSCDCPKAYKLQVAISTLSHTPIVQVFA